MSQVQETQGRGHEISDALSGIALDDSSSSLPTSSPFYRPLLGSEIRLIRLGPGGRADPISCELIYVSLDDGPKYVALSYAWGDPTNTRSITLNGQSYNITSSLFRGLRRLRHMVSKAGESPEFFITENLESFYLWADAICINQEDEVEKIHEISRMRDIYTYTDRVCAWLGENEQEERDIIYQMMGMAHCLGLASDIWELYLIELFDNSIGIFERFTKAMIKLSSRKWWSRIWVIQEVCLASKTPIILAGGAWSYMGSFIKFVEILLMHPKNLTKLSAKTFVAQGSHFFLFEIRKDYQKDKTHRRLSEGYLFSPGASLEEILRTTVGNFDATLPHDYIYAPPPRERSITDAILLDAIQQFDSFISKVSTIKHSSKDEILEEWLASNKEYYSAEFPMEDLKKFYCSMMDEAEVILDQQTHRARDILKLMISTFTIFVTDSGVLGVLNRRDKDAELGDVMVVVQGASSPLLLRPSHEDGEYEYLGFCDYEGFEYNEGLFSGQVLKQFVLV